MQDWKELLGATFHVEVPTEEELSQKKEAEQVPKGDALAQQGKQQVNVLLDKKGRNGKKFILDHQDEYEPNYWMCGNDRVDTLSNKILILHMQK